MEKQVTILEEIISNVGIALYQKWYNAMPEEEKNPISSQALQANANETAIFVIKIFMDKFNEAAEELKEK